MALENYSLVKRNLSPQDNLFLEEASQELLTYSAYDASAKRAIKTSLPASNIFKKDSRPSHLILKDFMAISPETL